MHGLAELHDEIDQFFRALSRERGGPAWIIEHPLDAERRPSLQRALGEALAERPLDGSHWWRIRAWPLLVEATEVGYIYEGPGEPYWPTLEAVLGRELRHDERAALSDHFAAAAEVTTRPPADPWSEQFCHMAWPVTHALLPLGVQLNLYTALIDHDQPLRLRDDPEGSIEGLRERVMARHPRSRLLPLLNRPRVAASLIEALLGMGTSDDLVRVEVLQRFASDSRRGEAIAMARQARRRIARDERVLALRGRRRSRSGRTARVADAPPARHDGRLQLRRDGGADSWSLHVVAPRLPDDLAARVPQRPFKPLGVGRGASLRSVARGDTFPLGAVALPRDEERLIPDAAERIADEQLALRLSAMHLDLRRPMLFTPTTQALSPARQVVARRLFGAGPWLVLAEPGDQPPGSEALGGVAALELFQVSRPLSDEQRQWCKDTSLGVVDRGQVDLFAPPEASAEGDAPPRWPHGSPIFLRVKDLSGGGRVSLGEESIDVGEAAIVACSLGAESAGPLMIEWQGEAETIEFDVEPVDEDAPLVTVELVGAAQTLDALRNGTLGVALRSDVPLAGLSVVMKLRFGPRVITRVAFGLPPLPCTVGAHHSAFTALIEAAEDVGALTWDRATFTVEVGALAQRTWLLEETPRVVWWQSDASGVWGAGGEAQSWGVGQLSPEAPWMLAGYEGRATPPAAVLLALDGEGRPLLGSGRCVGQDSLNLSAFGVRRPARLVRSMTREVTRGANVAQLTLGWLGWRLADAQSLVSDSIRRRVAAELEGHLVGALCGAGWAAAEERLIDGLPAESLPAAIARTLFESDLARDAPFEEALGAYGDANAIRAAIESTLARWVSAELPVFEASAELGVDDSLGDWLNDGLNKVLRTAWTTLTDQAPLTDEDEPDLWHSSDDWRRALRSSVRAWSSRRRLGPLLALCHPVDEVTVLVELPYAVLTDDEVVDHLKRWHKGCTAALFTGPGRARAWPDEVIEDLYDLWQRPQRVAERRRWSTTLDAALGSQFACRAIRYAVMRRRAALRGEEAS